MDPANCGGSLDSSLFSSPFTPIYQGGGQVTGMIRSKIAFSLQVDVEGNTCASGSTGDGGGLICDGNYPPSYDGSWEITLLILGHATSTLIPQAHVSQVQHQFTAADLWRQSALLAGTAFMEQSAGSTQAILFGALFADGSAVASADQQLVQGSADTNFTVIALPVLPSLTALSFGSDFTQAEADAFNVWTTNLVEQSVFAQAIATCFNRAAAASAATNAYWEQQQVNAIYQYEAQFAWYLDAEPASRSNFVAALEADGFPAITIDPTNAIAFQQNIASNGLPSVLVSNLTALGESAAAITNIQNSFGGIDPFGAVGTFPQSLMNTNLDSSSHALATDMRSASLVLINASLLPGGQLRFDVPTEPGFMYNIQVTQDLANPTNWTTLATMSATTYLLSYTNNPSSGGQVVFYKVTQY